MVRFIIKRKFKDNNDGFESESFRTIDLDVPELEQALNCGGFGPSGYDHSDLVGIEIINPK